MTADSDSSPRALLKAASQLTTGGLVLGGLVGALAVGFTGPYLAMGLAIWSGQTTEPSQPAHDYPVALTLLLIGAWGVGIWGEHRSTDGRHRPYRVLAWAGALSVALLPMAWLWRLWGEAAL